MKLKTIVTPEFDQAMKKIMSQPIAAKTSYKLARVLKTAQEHARFYEEARRAAIKKFAVLSEDGKVQETKGAVDFKSPEDMELCRKEIDELGDNEVDIPRILLADLGDVKIEPLTLVVLDDIIVEQIVTPVK